jgi:hypothetical protein
MNSWTLERRKRQSEMIRSWRPWEKSTGPRTEGGKQASARRGYKGATREVLRSLGRALREQRQGIENISL